ncbi:A-agglutinin attachment subunit precursor, putative [Trichomonas vaginalis G3]|uniref:A-agglutinin attachment subunit, putative n=1 Tax=Trichomonas vaginalis (strain ATCC PRA-98 / G3) TaxID=412133 RepID=A2DM57_TRIV3|nr:pectin lyase-like family [Trichomonas vaginalis G3]EAY18477.1 A-agglutinin attachment subunit precursor, putative [Trichomonas vaginalis G3]KAI5489534.1 pectin lyase-like family [Trichomonas vaginalis G3]|eukprot:XP_001579463.1 A-agglutinin attachment subunit precursor [Trichomonas vaginalis G3]
MISTRSMKSNNLFSQLKITNSFSNFIYQKEKSILKVYNSEFKNFQNSVVRVDAYTDSTRANYQTFDHMAQTLFDPNTNSSFLNCIFSNSQDHGAINSTGPLFLKNCTFTSCASTTTGGAISVYSIMILYDCTFESCSAQSDGCAFYCSASTTGGADINGLIVTSCTGPNSTCYIDGTNVILNSLKFTSTTNRYLFYISATGKVQVFNSAFDFSQAASTTAFNIVSTTTTNFSLYNVNFTGAGSLSPITSSAKLNTLEYCYFSPSSATSPLITASPVLFGPIVISASSFTPSSTDLVYIVPSTSTVQNVFLTNPALVYIDFDEAYLANTSNYIAMPMSMFSGWISTSFTLGKFASATSATASSSSSAASSAASSTASSAASSTSSSSSSSASSSNSTSSSTESSDSSSSSKSKLSTLEIVLIVILVIILIFGIFGAIFICVRTRSRLDERYDPSVPPPFP